MSRYYLDDADVDANRKLYDIYIAEASRLIECGLPVPAHTYVLKSSHAFNVLDARGAISTTERAKSFATMRRLSRDVGKLWVTNREALGFPLLREAPAPDAAQAELVAPGELPTTPQTAIFEVGTEELPPHVVLATIDAVRGTVMSRLGESRLPHGEVTVDGTPRRILIRIADVEPVEPDAVQVRRGPRWAAAYDAAGEPTRALIGFLQGQGAGQSDVIRREFGGTEYAAVETPQPGRSAVQVLTDVFTVVVSDLRADKNMRWNDPKLAFSRPIRWLLGLWGPAVLQVRVSGLTAGRTTFLHRFSAHPVAEVPNAEAYDRVIAESGIVLSYADRREQIVEAAKRLAAEVNGSIAVGDDDSLLDEIANLVEEPTPIRGAFEDRYLELPEQILINVMRKHQRYLPLRDASGKLLPYFVTAANGPCDVDLVRAGNESVLRARYEDAAFFFAADLQVPLAKLHAKLSTLTFEDRLGSVAERAERINEIAHALEGLAPLPPSDRAVLDRAGQIVKFDLASQMVVEMSSLTGYMAREYALRAGEPPAVAETLAEAEQPRTVNAPLPMSAPGQLLSLGDRLDLLTGMFAVGVRPTGSSDPFGLRRAALGVIAVLRNSPSLARVTVDSGLEAAAAALRAHGVPVPENATTEALEFVVGRFVQQLRDEGVPSSLVAALMPSTSAPGLASSRLSATQKLLDDASFRSLVTMLQRIERLVPDGTPPAYDPALLTEPSEDSVISALSELPSTASDDLPAFAVSAASLVGPVNTFFDDVLVMAPDPAVRAARLGLLASVRATAPNYLDWKALHSAISE